MQDHREAMECRDCEAALQLGIDASNPDSVLLSVRSSS
jgi:hypothetical protein